MTIKRITFLQEFLTFLGLEGRLHLDWISSAEAHKFVTVVTEFTNKIKELGPSPFTAKYELSDTTIPEEMGQVTPAPGTPGG
jgi:F420-non-reducing hydrogenase iron-sulfur subunit